MSRVRDKGMEQGYLARTALSYFPARLSQSHSFDDTSTSNLNTDESREIENCQAGTMPRVSICMYLCTGHRIENIFVLNREIS